MIPGRIYKVEAIVLARRNIGEADRILTLFTKEYGKIRAIAKGIRRVTSRRAPHAEIFSQVVIMLHQGKSSLDLVSEITPLSTYQNLRKRLERISAAYYLCELVDRLLPERQEHRDVYVLLVQQLKRLNDLNFDNTARHGEEFALELLRKLGFLAADRELAADELKHYIENIIQRHLRTPRILNQLG